MNQVRVSSQKFHFRSFFLLVLLVSIFTNLNTANAATFTVTNTNGDTSAGSLGAAINSVNSGGGGTIDLSGISAGSTINLSVYLPYITQSVTILGNNVYVNGQNLYGVFNLGGGVSIAAGLNDSISNLNILNGKAQGSNGGNGNGGGGGGLGAGGGIFVNSGVTLTVNNVDFTGNAAVGGNGGGVASPGNYSPGIYSGGGGGFNGLGNGVNAIGGPSGAGGGPNGGAPGLADNVPGGAGGWGSGGGGAGWGATGGLGGFGGGAGGSDIFQGGNGGFGGGGGANGYLDPGGNPGLYGGRGGCQGCFQIGDVGGGGGAGLGGGIFLYQGASLNIIGSDFSTNTATGGTPGSGGNGSTAGQGLGQDIFTYGSAVVFGGSSSSNVPDTISGTGSVVITGTGTVTFTAANTYSGGTTLSGGTLYVGNDNNLGVSMLTFNGGKLTTTAGITSAKAVSITSSNGTFDRNGFNSGLSGVISGAGNFNVIGSGALTLSGNNTYSGGTSVTSGTLAITNNNSLGTGTLTVNNASVLIAGNLTAANAVVLNGTGDTVDTNGFNATLSGVVSGSAPLTKTGAGTLSLFGNNTYSGGTTLNAGTLALNNNNSLGTGALFMNATTLQAAASASLANNIGLGAGIDTVNTNGFNLTLSGVLSGAGTLAKTGTGTLTLSGSNTYSGGTSLVGGILSVGANNNLGTGNLTFNGGTLNTMATFSSAKNISLLAGNGTLDNTTGTTLTLSGVISGTGSLTKTGLGNVTLTGLNTYTGSTNVNGGTLGLGVSGALSTSTAVNVGASGTLDLLNNNQTLGSLAGSGAVIFGSGNLTVGNASNTTFSGVISGTGSLTKQGSGTLTLSGVNTFTGGTTLNAGTLSVSNNNNLGGLSGNLTFNGGTLLNTLGITSARNILLSAGGGTLNLFNTLTSTYSGVVSGTGSLTKVGAGTIVLSGVNTYSGGTNLVDGYLIVGNDNNLGTGNLSFNGGTLVTSAGITSAKNIALPGIGNFDTNGFNSTLSGVISGSGAFYKAGTGILTLSGVNTNSGGIYLNGGILSIGNDNNLGTGFLYFNGGSLRTTAGITSSKSFILGLNGGFDSNGFDSTLSGTLSGAGALTKTGAGVLTLSGNNTYSGGTNLNGGIVSVDDDSNLGSGNLGFDGGTLQTSAGITSYKNINLQIGGGTFDSNGSDSVLYGSISGSGDFHKIGTGTLYLSSNSYTGATDVSGGTLALMAGDALSSSWGVWVASGATLDFLDNNQSLASLSGLGSVQMGAGNLTVGSGNFSGILSGSGGITKTGSGTLILSGVNTYSGDTTLSGGILSVGNDNNLGTGSLVFDGGTLQTSAAITSAKGVNVTSNGGIFDSNGFDSTLTGSITGVGGLVKTGSGALTLTGVNTYTGGTQINVGTLVLGDANSLTARVTGPVDIANGAILTGYGSVLGIVNNNGRVQPGGTDGVLSIGQLIDSSNSTLGIELAPGNYQSGRLNALYAQLDGTLDITADPGSYGVRYKYVIVTTGAPVTGTFANVTDNLSYMDANLTYGNNSVTLTYLRNNVDFAANATSAGQAAVGQYLNQSIPTADDAFIVKLNELYALPGAEIPAVLAQMGGASYASLASVILNNSRSSASLLFQRSRVGSFNSSFMVGGLGATQFEQNPYGGRSWTDSGDKPASATPSASRESASSPSQASASSETQSSFADDSQGLWAQSAGSQGKTDALGDAPGTDIKNYGVAGGYDALLAKDLKAGFSMAYNHADLNSIGSISSATGVESYQAALYASRSFSTFEISAQASFGVDRYESLRNVGIGSDVSQAQARFGGNQISGALRAEVPLTVSEFTIRPMAGLQVTHLTMDGFTETGAGSLDLNVSPVTQDSIKPVIGASASTALGKAGEFQFVPAVGFSFAYELASSAPGVKASFAGAPSSTFTMTGPSPDPALLGVGAGVKLMFGKNWNVNLGYRGDFLGSQSSNSFNGGVNFSL